MFTLSRRHHPLAFTSFLLLAAAPLAFTAGCFVTVNDGPGGAGGSGGSGGDTTTSSSSDSSSSSGGQGGSGPSSSSAGNGGAGGGSVCVGPDGTGQTAASCNLMEITPSKCGGPASSNCDLMNGGTGGTDDPPGFAVCIHGFTIFTAGSAENLRACLGQINGAPAYACDGQAVQDCVTRVYNDACPSQLAADSCQLMKDSLCNATESFDLARCADDLKPFNAAGMQMVADCITGSTDPVCQSAYDTCFSDTLSAPLVTTCP